MSTLIRFLFHRDPLDASLFIIRIGLCLLAFWFFVSHWNDSPIWFGENGIASQQTLSNFFDTADMAGEAAWYLSPLYWTTSTTVIRAYLIAGMALAIAAALYPSRLLSVPLWLACVGLANRGFLIAGTEDALLCSGLAYLAIARPLDCQFRTVTQEHWCTVLSRRMFQVHVTVLLIITGWSMLSSPIWWDGTASISIAAPTGRRLLDVTSWVSSPWIHEPLTHAILLTTLAAPLMLWVPKTRSFAVIAVVIWCVTLAILSSQWLYLSTLAVCVQSFWRQTPTQ